MAVRYRDRETGLYVSREKWARSRGRTGRYVRVNEKYGKGKRGGGKKLPPYKPPIPPIGQGPTVERLRYQEADKRRTRDIEIISEGGKVVSVRVGARIYTHEADFVMLKGLVESARIEGTEIDAKQFRAGTRPRARS
jgi:hypothetical protein